jgi:hypothetical protein
MFRDEIYESSMYRTHLDIKYLESLAQLRTKILVSSYNEGDRVTMNLRIKGFLL